MLRELKCGGSVAHKPQTWFSCALRNCPHAVRRRLLPVVSVSDDQRADRRRAHVRTGAWASRTRASDVHVFPGDGRRSTAIRRAAGSIRPASRAKCMLVDCRTRSRHFRLRRLVASPSDRPSPHWNRRRHRIHGRSQSAGSMVSTGPDCFCKRTAGHAWSSGRCDRHGASATSCRYARLARAVSVAGLAFGRNSNPDVFGSARTAAAAGLAASEPERDAHDDLSRPAVLATGTDVRVLHRHGLGHARALGRALAQQRRGLRSTGRCSNSLFHGRSAECRRAGIRNLGPVCQETWRRGRNSVWCRRLDVHDGAACRHSALADPLDRHIPTGCRWTTCCCG